ncbi:MAG TPA: DUF1648 domain-containing protein [Trueperaceae bacterium]
MTDFFKRTWLPASAWVVMIATSVYAGPRLPPRLPVHWGLSGEPDRYGSRFEALWLMPALVLALLVLFSVLSRLDANASKNRHVIAITRNALVAGFAMLHLGIIASYLGWEPNIIRLVNLVLGVILLLVGNILPKTQPSRWVGIRLPWTYASKNAWYLAQRLGGWVMASSGAALVITAFLTDRGPVFLIILALMILGLGTASACAYLVAHRDHDSGRAL